MSDENETRLFENLISKKELAKKIGMSESFINKWMLLGLPYYKVGRYVRFEWNQVVRWLERRNFNAK